MILAPIKVDFNLYKNLILVYERSLFYFSFQFFLLLWKNLYKKAENIEGISSWKSL